MLDSSGSINDIAPGNWQRVKDFVSTLITALDIQSDAIRTGLVKYSSQAINEFYLDTYTDKAEMLKHVNRMTYMGNKTNTALGLEFMTRDHFSGYHGDRANAPNVAVVITDGASTLNAARTIPNAVQARENGITIIAVGITDLIDVDELRLMSSEPQKENENWFRTPNFHQLSSMVQSISNSVCSGTTPVVPIGE